LWPHLSRPQKVQLRHRSVFAGQTVGIKEVHDDIWLVSSMDYGFRILCLPVSFALQNFLRRTIPVLA
jgi:hypothetical protein